MANRRGGKKPWGGGKASHHLPATATSQSKDVFPSSRPGSAVHGFTMRDEARNTTSHEPLRNQTAKLRQKPVIFVSAGFVEPLKDDSIPGTVPGSRQPGNAGLRPPYVDSVDSDSLVGEARPEVAHNSETNIAVGGHVARFEQSAPESAALESREETYRPDTPTAPGVFFFDLSGEKATSHNQRPAHRLFSSEHEPENSDSSDEVILFKGRSTTYHQRVTSVQVPQFATRSAAGISRVTPGEPQTWHLKNQEYTQKGNQPSTSHRLESTHSAPRSQAAGDPSEVDDEDAVLADYIANMANSEDDRSVHQLRMLSQRELGGADGAFGEISSDSEEDEASNTDASDTDSDKPILRGLPSQAASDQNQTMESSLGDEALALFLAGQEQLGTSSDEPLIPSAASRRFNSQDMNQQPPAIAVYRPRIRHANDLSVTEALDGLDITAWCPPDAVAKRKGQRRKQPPNFNVSDSELESALRKAWERDRERKKNRKMEREALRASGLLGKSVNPDDLRVKYQSGMKLDDIKAELLAFLLGSAETIQFPPMDKQARKMLHELANRFKIKSQSTGRSDQRRPVLYRTKRTVRYSDNRSREAEAHVEEAAAWIGRKYFHRLDVKGKGSLKPSATWGRSGHKSISYRDGEIAGASIPELSQENKGRAMLEKMGWAKGMALGSTENKGILEPVAQVVKRSKAGLG